MTVRPLLLPDTVTPAGFDHIDPISQWFLGGSGTAGAAATGILDDDRYGLEIKNSGAGGLSFKATSGNSLNQIKVDNTSVTIAGTVILASAPIGMMTSWPVQTPPTKWLLCDGSVVSQASYASLYTLITTTFNTGGEGAGNFRLPDLRGRVIITVSGAHAVGATGGAETVDVSHTHAGGTLSFEHQHSHSHGGGSLSLEHAHSHSHGPGSLSLGHRHNHSHGGLDHNHTVTINSSSATNTTSVSSGGGNAASGDHGHTVMATSGKSGSSSTDADNNDITSTTTSSGSTASDANGISSTGSASGSTGSDSSGISSTGAASGASGSGGSATQSVMQPFINLYTIIYAGA